MAADDHPFQYSQKYNDDKYEYRHVTVPREMAGEVPKDRLMSEREWRALGICQSLGWEHYAIHKPEPHVLLFRRPLGLDGNTGKVDARVAADLLAKFRAEYEA